MWTYDQATGELKHGGAAIAVGYSGNGAGKNNPDAQAIHDVGPIPRGAWIIGSVVEGSHLGPHVMSLIPTPLTATLGRTGFFIHGDSIADPGHGSCGCVILDPYTRGRLAETKDRYLQVI